MPLLAVDFPPESAEWTFFVAALVLLAGPVVADRLGLPGLVGIVLGGTLVGPFVLDWIAREGIIEALGDLGLLYLMFLAGLELDLDEFQRNRRPALTFGGLTFTLPFVLGFLLVLPFGYGLATAALYGSLWASHTLISYPIVQERKLTRHRAVGMAAGGTVITDTLALFVLAVVVGSVDTDARPARIVLILVLGLAVLAVYCALLLPFLGRWALARLGEARMPRFLFLLAALTSAALVAHQMGLEGIIGAFFAGLALNRLVPTTGQLMHDVEFVGGALLVPFFFLVHGHAPRPGSIHRSESARSRGGVSRNRAHRQVRSLLLERAALGVRRSRGEARLRSHGRPSCGDACGRHYRHRGGDLR